ncbi:hypothetical protein [Streptomyces sp. NPDC002490]|uniref:hypothetical protein n=1 Tax=Streptomyces sp. NPDC002490 TaxID=3154416 RepID=UPI00331F974B
MRTVTTEPGRRDGGRSTGRTGPRAAGGVLAAALLLTGCAGADGDTGDAGARTTTPAPSGAPATSIATPSAPRHLARPDVRLPRDLTERFDEWFTEEPEKDLVLSDAGQAQGAVLDALVRGSADTAAVRFFFTGEARSAVGAYVRDHARTRNVPTGFVRYHSPELGLPDAHLEVPTEGRASLSFCVDESRLHTKDLAGEVDRTPRGAEAHVRYDTRLRLSARGVWQTYELATERGTGKCRP